MKKIIEIIKKVIYVLATGSIVVLSVYAAIKLDELLL